MYARYLDVKAIKKRVFARTLAVSNTAIFLHMISPLPATEVLCKSDLSLLILLISLQCRSSTSGSMLLLTIVWSIAPLTSCIIAVNTHDIVTSHTCDVARSRKGRCQTPRCVVHLHRSPCVRR